MSVLCLMYIFLGTPMHVLFLFYLFYCPKRSEIKLVAITVGNYALLCKTTYPMVDTVVGYPGELTIA